MPSVHSFIEIIVISAERLQGVQIVRISVRKGELLQSLIDPRIITHCTEDLRIFPELFIVIEIVHTDKGIQRQIVPVCQKSVDVLFVFRKMFPDIFCSPALRCIVGIKPDKCRDDRDDEHDDRSKPDSYRSTAAAADTDLFKRFLPGLFKFRLILLHLLMMALRLVHRPSAMRTKVIV